METQSEDKYVYKTEVRFPPTHHFEKIHLNLRNYCSRKDGISLTGKYPQPKDKIQ